MLYENQAKIKEMYSNLYVKTTWDIPVFGTSHVIKCFKAEHPLERILQIRVVDEIRVI